MAAHLLHRWYGPFAGHYTSPVLGRTATQPPLTWHLAVDTPVTLEVWVAWRGQPWERQAWEGQQLSSLVKPLRRAVRVRWVVRGDATGSLSVWA